MSQYIDILKARLENIAKNGFFGDGKLHGISPASDEGIGVQYQSALKFFVIEMTSEDGEIRQVPVVVKIQVSNEMGREMTNSNVQFCNEVAMYDQILTKLGAPELGVSPRCYYGLATAGKEADEDIIVLEDLRHQKYRIADDINFDFDHAVFTLRKLGEFHGLSYKMKKSSPDTLRNLAGLLTPVIFSGAITMGGASMLRGFRPLMENSPPDSVVNKAYKKLSSISSEMLSLNLGLPEEPFAVILHGDFNRNNLLYAYDENKKVAGMKMLDFAFARYGDPAVDISFCLYLNTSKKLRDQHWREFLLAYWSGVKSVVEDPGFTFDQFEKNFAKKALYGYVPCSYFLPSLMDPRTLDIEEFLRKTLEERIELALSIGGEEATAAISAIVEHLLDAGYLEEYLLNF